MKRLLSWSFFQEAFGALLACYVAVLTRTLRWRIEGWEAAEAGLAGSRGALALFWHGRLGHAMACLPLLGRKPRRVLISFSRDGEFIAAAARRMGAPSIRGSSARAGGLPIKGGALAFRQAVQFLQSGGAVLITPDGPRGPREVLPMGPLQLARNTGACVFLLGLAARPAIRLKTWDGMHIPLPFARARLVIAGPLTAPKRLSASQAEALRADWQARFASAQARAEALVG